VLFTEEWFPSGHFTIKVWSAAEMVVLLEGSPISTEELWSFVRVTIRFLVNSPTKAFLPQLLSLARQPALGRVLVVTNFFHLRMIVVTVFLGTFNAAAIFGTLPQICAWTQSCLGALRTVTSTSWLGFCSDMHYQLWHLGRYVLFQIMSNQFNLQQVDSNQVVET
jgi:hypothetical protein